MTDNIAGRGNNIKCYDKIKITNVLTGQILHTCNFEWNSGSKNQAVTCHKSPDDSDWFVPIQPQQPQSSYYFKYKDSILLCSSMSKKYLNVSPEFESIVSKKMEICLKDLGSRTTQWIVQAAQQTSDEFWRVGQLITLKNKGNFAYLGSHKRRIRQNDEYEVFGQLYHWKKNPKRQIGSTGNESPTRKNAKEIKQQKQQLEVSEEYLWRVTEIVPFIYTPPITDKKKLKPNAEEQQLARLTKMRNSLPQKPAKKIDQSVQILKSESRRMEQVQVEASKQALESNKQSCWKKICCCFCIEPEGYSKIN